MVNTVAQGKIITPDELVAVVEEKKAEGLVVVQCHGVFDLMHLGHIRHFTLAKKEGDVLVVSLTSDAFVKRGPGRPVFNQHLRAEAVASLAIVDYVTIIDSPTAIEFIRMVKPSVYVKGSDYKEKEKDITGKIYDEQEAIESVGGRLAFTDDITFSSSKLLNNYLDVFPPRTFKYLKAIGQRYTIDEVVNGLQSLRDLKALVIGDTIIDEYHYCHAMGKSSKEHLVANRFDSDEKFAGGALATANNVASVCGSVDLFTVLGETNSNESFITSRLQENVKPYFFYRQGDGTIIKRRYVSKVNNRKLFEICYMNDVDIEEELQQQIIARLKATIKNYDVVIISDFGHGLMTKAIREFICQEAQYVALNVQTNSANIGFNLVTKYPAAQCVCIDEMELRFAAHDKFSDIRKLLKTVHQQIDCQHLIATRGAHGSMYYSDVEGYHETPAFSYRVVDAIGAGDAFFAFVGPCFAAGLPSDLTSFIGNAVGSLAVQIVCNREPVTFVDLSKFISRLLK